MSAADDMSVSGCVASRTPTSTTLRSALALTVLTGAAALWQTRWGTVPDTSWLITVGERVLDGERLYVDVMETNPPFSVWLYLPAVAAARALGLAPEVAVHAWTYGLGLIGLLLSALVLHRSRLDVGMPVTAWLLATWILLVIFPGQAFSEREHIGVALFLPMAALMAWRASGTGRPGAGLAATVGLAGSMLLLVKPYYALMVLAPPLVACARHRSLRPLLTIEHVVIGGVCMAYLAAVAIFHPDFLSTTAPLLTDTYLQIRTFWPIVLTYGPAVAAIGLAAAWLWPREGAPAVGTTFLLVAAAAIPPLFLQGKGWAYHAYPALLFGALSLMTLAASRGRFAIALVAIAASFLPFWPTQKPSDAVVDAIRQAVSEPSVALIGADIGKGHPLVRMVDGRWVSAHVSDWLGTSALHLAQAARRDGQAQEAARYRMMVHAYVEAKRQEFIAQRPDIVVLQKSDAEWIRFLSERHGFAMLLASYGKLVEDDGVIVLLRDEAELKDR